MKNDVELDSVAEDPGKHIEDEHAHEVWAQGQNGARLAVLAQLEFSRQREMNARLELQQVRYDSAREQKNFENLLHDAKQRSLIQIEIERAENDHLKRSIADLEAAAREAREAFELRQAKISALNTDLQRKLSELKTTRGNLEATVLRLEKEAVSNDRAVRKKEAFGRDKSRRLDTALEILAKERSRMKSLEESSSLRIGRLITSSLKNPLTAIALIWRLPKLIFIEFRNKDGRVSS